MTATRHGRLTGLATAYLDRPVVDRAAVLMAVFAVGHVLTTSLSAAVLLPSGYTERVTWSAMMIAICSFIVLMAAVLLVLARRDPDGLTRASRAAMTTAATGYTVCAVAMAYGFGVWATPFLAIPLVWIILVAIVLDRRRALVCAVTTAGLVVLLQTGQHLAGWSLAPALAPLSDTLLGSWQASLGSAIPLVAFTFVTSVLSFTVLAILEDQRESLIRTHELIRTYVPAQVADAVLASGPRATALERRKLTIFFSDVVTFTDTTDRMEPEELARVLDDYFSEMTRIAEKYDGTIDELIGDAVLIFFGAPTATDDRDHAVRATRMAVEMQRAVARLNASWEAAGIDAVFEVRMGINTGIVTVGNVGTGGRRKYAALGRGVNLAARIQTHCPSGGILLSRSTWLLTRDVVPCRLEGEVELKGVGRPTELYAVDLSAAAADE